jgi:hypothetical protein
VSKKYVVVVGKNLEDIEKELNESAELGYRFLALTPIYAPTFFSQKLYGYVAVVTRVGEETWLDLQFTPPPSCEHIFVGKAT